MRDYNFVSPVMVVEPSPPPTQPQASDFITPEIFASVCFCLENQVESAHLAPSRISDQKSRFQVHW